MAEPKRVPLLPVKPGSTITNGKTPFDDPLAAKSKDEDEETIRLEISLSDSTETGCPEFSYLKQIKLKMVRFTFYLQLDCIPLKILLNFRLLFTKKPTFTPP